MRFVAVTIAAVSGKKKTALAASSPRFGAQRLYRDATSMASSSVVNAFFGVGFWAIAAKTFPPHQLGVMTAVLAVIVSVSTVVASGVGDAYTALLPAAGSDRPSLYRRGQRIFYGITLVSGGIAALCTTRWLPETRGSVGVAVLVALGVVACSVLALQNSTLVALGRAHWLPAANIAASALKIMTLLLLAVTCTWHPVELSVVISAFAVIVVLQPVIARTIYSGKELPLATVPEGYLVSRFKRFVAQTVLSSALSTGLLMVTPFLVTVFSNPKQGALFSLSLAIVSALDLVGAALANSLVVHASSTPDQAYVMARRIMVRAVLISIVGGLGLAALAPTALRLLNPAYGAMGAFGVIAVLAAASVPACVYRVWSALQRARRNMVIPLTLNATSVIVLIAGMPALAHSHGALGGAITVLLATLTLNGGILVHYVARKIYDMRCG
jgi:O-antigen/teichoic acid export membrane protein